MFAIVLPLHGSYARRSTVCTFLVKIIIHFGGKSKIKYFVSTSHSFCIRRRRPAANDSTGKNGRRALRLNIRRATCRVVPMTNIRRAHESRVTGLTRVAPRRRFVQLSWRTACTLVNQACCVSKISRAKLYNLGDVSVEFSMFFVFFSIKLPYNFRTGAFRRLLYQNAIVKISKILTPASVYAYLLRPI